MIDRVVAIVGPMRSGTSLVAAVVHHLGYPVSLLIPAPAAPSWRSDWEDLDLSMELMRGEKPTVEDFEGYLKERAAESAAVGFEGRVAVKSPYLALSWENFAAAARDPFVIRTRREVEAQTRSFLEHPQLRLDDQMAIHEALVGIPADLEVSYDEIVADPYSGVVNIALALGVEDFESVHRAIALVGKPTEYATWHTS